MPERMLCAIPARGGSKRLARKNLLPLAGFRGDNRSNDFGFLASRVERDLHFRFALLAARGLKGSPDRAAFSLGGGRLRDLLEGEPVRWRRVRRRRGRPRAFGEEAREVRGLDEVRAEDNGLSNHVSELPDVARPGIPSEQLERFVRDAARRSPQLDAGLDQEPLRQVGDVLRSLPQRWQDDHELSQPVIEILSETSDPDVIDQRGAVGGEDSDVHGSRASASQTLHPVLL